MRIPLAASFLLLLVSPASADLDGQLLHQMCKAKNIEFVAGYVAGVTDKAAHDAEFVAHQAVNHADTAKRTGPEIWDDTYKAMRTVQPFCIKDAKLGEMVEFVCKALEVLPEVRKHKAAAITADVLKVKYPCKAERPPEMFKPENFTPRSNTN